MKYSKSQEAAHTTMKLKSKTYETDLVSAIVDIFNASRNNYGTLKFKVKRIVRNIITSCCRIDRIMKFEKFISTQGDQEVEFIFLINAKKWL